MLILFFLSPGPARADPGRLISVEPTAVYDTTQINQLTRELFGNINAPLARFPVDSYLIRYQSTDLSDSDTEITAQLFVPRLSTSGERPVYIFAPGSTGLTEACRPSRELEPGISFGPYLNHTLAHAGQGLIVVMPDYMYAGESDPLQLYFIAEAEGRVLLDAARVVRRYFTEHDTPVRPSAEVFFAGYSQGGHAVFAAADLRSTYAPEVKIGGLIGYGPTTDLENLLREFTVVAPLVVYTYAGLYGEDLFPPEQILAERWLSRLEYDVTRMCIRGIQQYYPWDAGSMFTPDFTEALLADRLEQRYPKIHRLLAMNNTGLSGHGIPALILQGTDDIVVYPDSQTEFVLALRALGSEVRYLIFTDARHDTRQIGFNAAVEWMERNE